MPFLAKMAPMSPDNLTAATKDWYRNYAGVKGDDRNDLVRNPGVLFQTLAMEMSVIRAMRSIPIDPATSKVLDVGCGWGGSLFTFVKMRFQPHLLYGVDIHDEMIAYAKGRFSSINFSVGDARKLDFPDHMFDIVTESYMFVQLTDETVSHEAADEMLRVLKPSGYLLLVDWRYSRPGDPNYVGLSKARVRKLFHVGERTEFLSTRNGALIPPLGRFVSRFLPSFYFLIQGFFGILAGQQAMVLRKRS
jgi:ubiquinone/menaquinone biosynthesis C-methylase UbiE